MEHCYIFIHRLSSSRLSSSSICIFLSIRPALAKIYRYFQWMGKCRNTKLTKRKKIDIKAIRPTITSESHALNTKQNNNPMRETDKWTKHTITIDSIRLTVSLITSSTYIRARQIDRHTNTKYFNLKKDTPTLNDMEQSLFKFQWRIGNNFLCVWSLFVCIFVSVFSFDSFWSHNIVIAISNFLRNSILIYIYLIFFRTLVRVFISLPLSVSLSVCLYVCTFSLSSVFFEQCLSNREQDQKDHCWFARNDLSLIICLMCVYPLRHCQLLLEFMTIIHSFSNCNV